MGSAASQLLHRSMAPHLPRLYGSAAAALPLAAISWFLAKKRVSSLKSRFRSRKAVINNSVTPATLDRAH